MYDSIFIIQDHFLYSFLLFEKPSNGKSKSGETATFSLAAGEGYEIVSDYSSGSFELVDTQEDLPPGAIAEPNDIIPLATDTRITPENPSFSGSDSIHFNIGNRILNPDGTYSYIDYAGNGDDTLILGKSERILAGAGDDVIFTTSGGYNIITGGAGADSIWIASAELPDKANIITDFTGSEDVIGIAGLAIGFSDVTITQVESDALITANDSDLAILQGVAADSLSADDFAFA